MQTNGFGRLLLFLFGVVGVCFCMYMLPLQWGNYRIKRVDLLSELRKDKPNILMDSLQMVLKEDTIVEPVLVKTDSTVDLRRLQQRDSLFKVLYKNALSADSTGRNIEDNTLGRVGLKRFFAALSNVSKRERPVRIAFLGDSFTEGDILVGRFRYEMQKKFGGRGVGFVHITTPSAQYRPTTKQKAFGWKVHSLLRNKGKHRYTLPAMLFEADSTENLFSLKLTERFNRDDSASSIKIFYERNIASSVRIISDEIDTCEIMLPRGENIQYVEKKGEVSKVDLSFSQTDSLRLLGVAMEDNHGVIVDNFAMRGSSGYIMQQLDSARCMELNNHRPYDLIVLQYGLNVVNDSILDYRWYGARMTKTIKHLQRCFPQADILMFGVSDRGKQENGTIHTMPAVLSMLHTQRNAARKAGVPFWNTFGAMGGEGSIARFVEKGWGSKDYTHISYRGGYELSKILMEALMKEKQFHDRSTIEVNEQSTEN